MRPRALAGTLLALGATLVASAHVGSSNAYFEGMAGPYPVRVIVRTPGVIPGLAQISVRIPGEQPARVTVRPVRWDAGLEGAPPPDTARAVAGEEGLYAAELWLMTFGSYSVHVEVSGPLGSGTAFVPVNAVAERRLPMNRAMAVALIGAVIFLFVGAITIFGAAVRESVLAPGLEPEPRRRRRAWVAMGVGGVLMALLLWGGWSWWGAVDAAYRDFIYAPLETSTTVRGADDARVLTVEITDPDWRGRQWTPLIPDHGKLMHMFLVRDGDLGGFAHVHPASADSNSFAVRFPPLPVGEYRMYADIVHESGFSQTLVDTVGVGEGGGDEDLPPRDPDDSWVELPAFGQARSRSATLPSGRTVVWEDVGPLVEDAETSLRFRVREPDGAPTALEPYMGMLSHAAVTRDDGSVFMHLHPSGSINMAAQQRFTERELGEEEGASDGGDAAMPAMDGMDATRPSDTVAFPFVFPSAGAWRIFVQVKVGGVVETVAFDADVAGT